MHRYCASLIPSPERQLNKRGEKAILKQAMPHWYGREKRLKKFVRAYLRRRRGDTILLESVIRSTTKAAMIALLILKLYASPLHAQQTPSFTEQAGSNNPLLGLPVFS